MGPSGGDYGPGTVHIEVLRKGKLMKMGTWPSIDHSLISPSGKMSKRARKAAEKRENERLFPPGFWDIPEPTESERREAKVKSLRLAAANLRALAARGMSTGKFNRQADKMEQEANKIEKGTP